MTQSIQVGTQLFYPSKTVCLGRNYVDHAKELNNEVPTEPVIFIKPNSAIGQQLVANNDQPIHYETEICFMVMNQKLNAVGLGLDLTKREVQNYLKKKGLPWERAKCFDGAALFSAFIPCPELLDNLRLELWINHELKQAGGVCDMLTPPLAFLREASTFMTLEDGDVLMTGTPAGVGPVFSGDFFEAKLYNAEQLLLQHHWSAS